MTNNSELTQALNDMQGLQKSHQTILAILTKYQELSKLIQQANAVCFPSPLSDDPSSRGETTPSPIQPGSATSRQTLNFKNMVATRNQTIKRSRPILYPDGQNFENMFKVFKNACKSVHKNSGPWSDITDLSSFDRIGYGNEHLSMKTMFNMLWFVSAAITQNLSKDYWLVDEDMQPFIEAINMLNSLEFVKN